MNIGKKEFIEKMARDKHSKIETDGRKFSIISNGKAFTINSDEYKYFNFIRDKENISYEEFDPKSEIRLAPGFKTESGRPLLEAAPNEFVLLPNGEKNWGEISQAVSKIVKSKSNQDIPPGKIRMIVGNESMGLIHCKKHENEFKSLGYNSVEEAALDIINNYEDVIAEYNRGNKPTYTLMKSVKAGENKKSLITPLTFTLTQDKEGNYYVVITAIPKRAEAFEKQKEEALAYGPQRLNRKYLSDTGNGFRGENIKSESQSPRHATSVMHPTSSFLKDISSTNSIAEDTRLVNKEVNKSVKNNKVIGRQDEVIAEDNTHIPFKYAVVEAEKVEDAPESEIQSERIKNIAEKLGVSPKDIYRLVKRENLVRESYMDNERQWKKLENTIDKVKARNYLSTKGYNVSDEDSLNESIFNFMYDFIMKENKAYKKEKAIQQKETQNNVSAKPEETKQDNSIFGSQEEAEKKTKEKASDDKLKVENKTDEKGKDYRAYSIGGVEILQARTYEANEVHDEIADIEDTTEGKWIDNIDVTENEDVIEENNESRDDKEYFVTGTFTHTKTGEKLISVKLADEVDYDIYKEVNKLARGLAYGGKWNRFSKSWLFSTEDKAVEFKEKANKYFQNNNVKLSADNSLENEKTLGIKPSDIIEIKGDEFGEYTDIKDLRAKAKQYYTEHLQGTSTYNLEVGKVDVDNISSITFTSKGKKKSFNNSANINKLLSIRYLPRLISTAKVLSYQNNFKQNKNSIGYYTLQNYVNIDGQMESIIITVEKNNRGDLGYYNHGLDVKKEDVYTHPSKMGSVSSKEALEFPPDGNTSSTFNLTEGVLNVNQKDKFSVYGNGNLFNEMGRRDITKLAKIVYPARLTTQEAEVTKVAKALGIDIAWVEAPSGLRGWHVNGTTFINRKANWTPTKIFWHESLHAMLENNPELHEEMITTVMDSFTDKQLEAYAKTIYNGSRMDKEELIEGPYGRYYEAGRPI